MKIYPGLKVVNDLGSFTCFNIEHPENNEDPLIVVTESGSSIDSRDRQLQKTLPPVISCNPSCKVTVLRVLQS